MLQSQRCWNPLIWRRWSVSISEFVPVPVPVPVLWIPRRPFLSSLQKPIKYEERKLVPHSKEHLYAVVKDVEAYQEFLPFCMKSLITRYHNEKEFEAELQIGFRAFSEKFISKVQLFQETSTIHSTLLHSPSFKHIKTIWHFESSPRSRRECYVNFSVEFQSKNVLTAMAMDTFFIDVSKQQSKAFLKRCKSLYGTMTAPHDSDDHSIGSESQPDEIVSKESISGTTRKEVPQDIGVKDRQASEGLKSIVGNDHLHSNEGQHLNGLAYAKEIFRKNRHQHNSHCSDESKRAILSKEEFEEACIQLASRFEGFKALSEDKYLMITVYRSLDKVMESLTGHLTLDEYVEHLYMLTEAKQEERARHLFTTLDYSGNGEIDRKELERGISIYMSVLKEVIPGILAESIMENKRLDDHHRGHYEENVRKIAEETIEKLMKEVYEEIPLAVDQVFRRVGKESEASISREDWEDAWYLIPELVDMMSIDGMRRMANYAAAIHYEEDRSFDGRLL